MDKFTNKLKNIHFLSLLGNGMMSVINMVTVAVLYRFLPIEDNGVWIFYQSAIIFIDTFRTGLLNTAVVKFYSGTTEQKGKEIIGSTWVLAILITFFLILLNIPFLFIINIVE